MGIGDNLAKFFRSATPLAKAVDGGSSAGKIETEGALPRRGLFQFAQALVQKKQQRPLVLNAQTLDRLARTDPVTWAILRTVKSRVNSTPWDIVPDTEKIEKELDRWEEYVVDSLNPYGIKDDAYKTGMLTDEVFQETSERLDSVLKDSALGDKDKIKAIRWVFKTVKKKISHGAQSHCEEVRELFERPNNSAETSLRALQELVIHDLLIYDAGVVVKNYDEAGRIAELYTVPGHEIKIYRNEDRTTPQPPEPAYVWEDQGIQRAEFVNSELIYIMQNPTHTGYGVSPLEVAAYVITASLYADQYNLDYFKNSNVPAGLISLGKDITEEQRSLFQRLWDNEVQGRAGGLHRMLFAAGSDEMKFVPLQTLSNRDMQMMEYLKWTVSIKCACYGVSPQDIGFTQDFRGMGSGGVAEQQAELTQARGINSILQLLEQYYNAEIVKSEFDYQDVKFAWQAKELAPDSEAANIDINDIKSGVLTINERRNKLGLKPVEGGDIPVIATPGGMIPVEKLDEQEDMERQESITGTPEVQPGQAVAPEGAAAPEQPGSEKPTTGQPPVEGSEEQSETAPTEKSAKPIIKIRVSKKKPNPIQREMLDKAITKLRDGGVDAELRIGFDD